MTSFLQLLKLATVAAVIISTSAAYATVGGPYQVSPSTIDSGGGSAIGGVYSVQGSMPFDVGVGSAVGGSYSVLGGFVPGSRQALATPTPTVTGTRTDTPTPTVTFTPSNTPEPTATFTPTPTETPGSESALVAVSPDEDFPLREGAHAFAFTFGLLMDRSVEPTVNYGLNDPFDFGAVEPDPGWVTDFVWVGELNVTEDTLDGLYTFNVQGARTESGLLLADNTNHQFRVQKVSDDELKDGTVTARTIDALALEWGLSGDEGVLRHTLVRSASQDGLFELVGDTAGLDNTFTDRGLDASTEYFYRVFEFNPNRKGTGGPNRLLTKTFGGSTLKSFVNARAVPLDRTNMRLEWDETGGSTGVTTIHVRRTQGFTDEEIGNLPLVGTVPASATAFLDQDLRPNRLYTYGLTTNLGGLVESPFTGVTPLGFEPGDLLWAIGQARSGAIPNDILFDFATDWASEAPGE